MFRWAIRHELARAQRPGYGGGKRGAQVTKSQVKSWIKTARKFGIRSIICLLDEQHLCLYERIGGLLSYYRENGFEVVHVRVRDHQDPPLNKEELRKVVKSQKKLLGPLLIHCSAGRYRTGYAIRCLKRLLEKG